MSNSNSIKILHITSYPPPRAGWGMRVYFLKKEMEQNGDICEVLNIGKSRFMESPEFVPVFGALDYFKKVLKFRLKGYKIHMHMNGDSPKGFVLTLIAQFVSLLTFTRSIITFHAGPVQLYFPQFKAKRLTPMYKLIFALSKVIICNNELVKENIAGYGVDSKKIFPIQAFSRQYLGFDEIEFTGELATYLKDNSPVIVSYVNNRPEFFIEHMMEAFQKFIKVKKTACLLIIAPEEGLESVIEMTKKYKIDHCTYFTGDLDHDSFLTLLSRSTLYLRTPLKDGVASSVLESLALKTPVVASDNGSRPASTITYENGNIDDMVEKLVYTTDNLKKIKTEIIQPEIMDTVSEEIELIKQA